MAETYVIGENKVRPGGYFNIQKAGEDSQASVINGVTAVIFRSDFGPLGVDKVMELSKDDSYESVYGTGLTTDALAEALNGGAETLICCRLGNGGTQAQATLNDGDNEAAVKITAKYPGAIPLTVTIREKLSDTSVKQCIIYNGTSEFEKVEFAAGTGEAKALADAFASSSKFTAAVETGKEAKVLANVSQKAFTAGTNPTVAVSDYSAAFTAVEPFDFNSICVDTEDTSVHLLLQAFMNRIFNAGTLAQAVIAEKDTVDLEVREAHAVAFNDEKMNYVLNAHVDRNGTELNGYQTAARIAGLIGACASNTSLTHTVINGFTEILEPLTNTQIKDAELKGCIVLSYNSTKQVWIDNAINTLITPASNQDDGWKKIRRVKTRFELIRRMNVVQDNLVGKVDNDDTGRKAVLAQLQAVGNAMISESKLIAFTAALSEVYKADGDSCWFEYDVVDKDSMEHIYGLYRFRFSTNV